MKNSKSAGFLSVIAALLIIGCQPEAEIGFQPPIVPVRVSINSSGELKVGFSGQIVTPIGTFDVGGGATIWSMRKQYDQKVLIVRVDDKAVVYALEEEKEFKVTFDDGNTLYKKVDLKHESDGDIVLELESGAPSVIYYTADPGVSLVKDSSCPGAKYPTRLEAGRDATVCTKDDRLIIRKASNMAAAELMSIYPGTAIKIVDGPVCSNDFWWWKVKIYQGTLYGLQDKGFDPVGTTKKDFSGWAREGWDNIDAYFLCQ
ncbi:MAG: hypothetical protein PGMFKBFP_02341 [Anaerolineales bacterium]|nr:hypothetical protein [Anaerolineales bacterium]MBW7918047.1 hypothetical protein [Anaerolineales bacterium]MCZ2288193.1 hypothetical protein [Anaerolineales bacterium]